MKKLFSMTLLICSLLGGNVYAADVDMKFCVDDVSSSYETTYTIRRFDNPYYSCNPNTEYVYLIIDKNYEYKEFYEYLLKEIKLVDRLKVGSLVTIPWNPSQIIKKEPSQTQKLVVEKKLKTTTKVTKLKKNTNNSYNSYSKILLKDDNQIHINTIDDWTTSKDTFEIAKKHCSSFGKYAFLVKRPAFRNSKLDKYYIKQGQKLNLSSVFEYICSKENIILAPSYAFSAGAKLDKKWSNFGISNNIGSGLKSSTNTNKSQNIMFTIKDKKEQCTAIGFKPETDKFADCVLRLVELDVKKQQTNKISTAQNSGNDALAKQLKQQQYDRDTQYLLDLGQQLLQPKSSSYSTCSYIDLGSGMSKVKCN